MSNMTAAVACLNENVLRINEALKKNKEHLLQRVQNLDRKIAEQQELSKTVKVAVKRCNMAAAVDSLAENLPSVNEAPLQKTKTDLLQRVQILNEKIDEKMDEQRQLSELIMKEDISMSDLKRNMAAGVGSLRENLQIVKEAVEKAKKHLLQRIPDEKIDEKQELSKLIMTEVRDTRAEVEKVNDELNNLVEKVRELVVAGKFRGESFSDQ